ncbi:MAG: 1-phosphofructokinase [Actinomycetota bacterium]|jgi:1-phosphofructokinase|nr:1-phosphofructokinase [Actinomycetota bacterium]
MDPARAAVLAPAPVLTVTVESRAGEPEIHFHAGGQGFWQARMIAALGVRVTLCGSFGGESGILVRRLIEAEGVDVHPIDVAGDNPAYVHDRRGGDREPVAETTPVPLARHEVDDLYGAMLVEGLEADVCVLGGTTKAGAAVDPDTYRRLATDLAANGRTVVADLAGEYLEAILDPGVTVLKVSDEELVAGGRAKSDDLDDVLAAIDDLCQAARIVVVSRAGRPAVATVDGEVVEIIGPRLQPFDHRGAGDSMTAGIAASLALGRDTARALRIGTAAGALNVTRRGLATGERDDIERMAGHVELRPVRRVGSER